MGHMKKIKHNDLTHYFLRDHKELPPAYLASCEKFFKDLGTKDKLSDTLKSYKLKSDIKGVMKLKYPLEYKYKL